MSPQEKARQIVKAIVIGFTSNMTLSEEVKKPDIL